MVWVGPAVHSGHAAHLLKNEDAWAKGTSTEPGAWTGARGLPCETTDPKVSFGGHRGLWGGGAWGHSHGYLSVGMDHVGAWVRVSSSVWQGGNGAGTISLGWECRCEPGDSAVSGECANIWVCMPQRNCWRTVT